MKNLKNFVGGMAMVALSLCLAACSSDDEPSYSTAAVTNSELMGILKGKGYQFNEQGNLLLDDKANQTTSLDLSGTNISVDALAELTILPNLTDVSLANNGYGPVFDVTKLPTQITGLDLRGNEVYDFEGLVSVNVVNDERETTVLHNFTKLYLPESAKYNVEDLMPYYEKAGSTTDMQMVNASGTLEKYNTLREIPDEYFRAYLNAHFSSLFSDDKLDISKPMTVLEQGTAITLANKSHYTDIDKIQSVEGVEYFINNPFYKSFFVTVSYKASFSVSYLMPRDNIKELYFDYVSFPKGMDLSKATKLSNFQMKNNDDVTELDLSNTVVGNQEISDFDTNVSNLMKLENCSKLEKVTMPANPIGIIATIELINLPLLSSIDLSGINAIENLNLIKLENCDIIYPNLQYRFTTAEKQLINISENTILFAISEDVFNKESTKEFINKYRKNLTDRWILYLAQGAFMWSSVI